IADGEHASRIFCQTTKNTDGTVRDCKTDFHTRKNSPIKKADRATINAWKEMYRRAIKMVDLKGNTVSTDDLNAYDIFLETAIRNEIHTDCSMTSYFRGFSILTNPFKETHFITINTFTYETF
ncbi:hypothetical protein ACFOW1_16990, partial [Parasediminibacterium paludis]